MNWSEWKQHEHRNNFKMSNNPSQSIKPRDRWYRCAASWVIDNPWKWRNVARVSCIRQIHVAYSNISSCCLCGGGAEERVHDKNIVLPRLSLFLVSFTSLFHHCQSLPFSASIIFAFSHSASIWFLFVLSLLPPLTYALSLSWHFFQAEVWGQLFPSDLTRFKCSHINKER